MTKYSNLKKLLKLNKMVSKKDIHKILKTQNSTNKSSLVKILKTQYKVPNRSAYRYVNEFLQNNSVFDHRINNNGKAKLNRYQRQGLAHEYNNKKGKSLRKSASKYNVSHETIRKHLQDIGVNFYKRKEAPKYTTAKLSQVKKKSSKLYREILTTNQGNPIVIIDDETYINENDASLFGNAGFYAKDKNVTPDRIRYKSKEKYGIKVGLWYAISEKGVSEHFTWKSGHAINQHIYKTECIEKRLIPFIKKYHSDDVIVFWPDNATSHYAKSVQKFFQDSQIPFVPKNSNPPNVPQARPIERAHAEIKRQIFKDGFYPKNERELIRKIDSIMKNSQTFLHPYFKNMSKSIRTKIDKIRRQGPLSILSTKTTKPRNQLKKKK